MMAWFHTSLQDMKEAIEREDWEEVKKILHHHQPSLDQELPKTESALLNIDDKISQYGEDIAQISRMLTAQMKGSYTKDVMLLTRRHLAANQQRALAAGSRLDS